MVAANGVMARTLLRAGVFVHPARGEVAGEMARIVELAADYGETLPAEPDSGALNAFLKRGRLADGVHYADFRWPW